MRDKGVGWGRLGRAAVILAWLALPACGHSIDVGGGAPLPPPGIEFLYCSNTGDGTISLFSVDHKTGQLTFVEKVSAGGPGVMGIAVAPAPTNAKYLFAVNFTAAEILGFKIDRTSGKLTPTAQGSISTGAGSGPTTLAVTPTGIKLYAIDTLKQQIFAFSIASSSGQLKEIGTPTQPEFSGEKLVSIAIASASQALYVADQARGQIIGYGIATDGSISFLGEINSLNTIPGIPMYLSSDPAGGANIFDADAGGLPGGSVSVFTVGVNGVLNAVGVFSVGHTINFPVSLTVSPTIPFLYTANGASGDVTNFSIGSTGALSRDTKFQSPFPNASSIAIDQHGFFTYVLDPPDALIFGESVNQTNGELSTIGPAFPTENPPNTSSAPFQIIEVLTPA